MSVRAYRAHIDEKASFHTSSQEPLGTKVNALHGCVVEQEGNHGIRIIDQFAERRGPLRSRLTGLARVVGSSIPYAHLMAETE